MRKTEYRRPKILSLGGGLDSWAMLLDAEIRGELPCAAEAADRVRAGEISDLDNHSSANAVLLGTRARAGWRAA